MFLKGPKMGQKWVKNLQKMGKKMAKNQRKITQFAFRKGLKVMNQFLNELAKNSQKFLIRKQINPHHRKWSKIN